MHPKTLKIRFDSNKTLLAPAENLHAQTAFFFQKFTLSHKTLVVCCEQHDA